jgi:hypothetical protein
MASPKSAADNVVYPMRRFGLFDESGQLTERGQKWRVDATYPEACAAIVKDVYPDALATFVSSDGTVEKDQVVTWFQHQGLGGSNASAAAATFAMIATAEVPQVQTKAGDRPQKSAVKNSRGSTTPSRSPSKKAEPAVVRASEPATSPSSPAGPVVHLDIQIHIPATADAEQIDQIFASMAKHLYK